MRALTLSLSLLVLLPLSAAAQGADPDAQGKSADEMRDANRAAAVLVLSRLKRDRIDDYRAFCRIRRADVLVVRGVYDHVETVLSELGVPYGTIPPDRVARASFAGVRIVFVNCPGKVGKAGVAALKRYVLSGGTLVTTDWAVLHVLEPAFPGTIRYTRRPTRDDVVKVDPPLRRHRIVMQVFTGDDPHVWWLENRSYPIAVLDGRRVTVLITSEEMKRKYGEPAIAVTFAAGRGRVYHMVSHTYLQRSELRTKRDRLPTAGFAKELGFGEDSEAMRRIRRAKLAGVPSGQLRSAYSVQQMLANLLVTVAPRKVEPPKPPRPTRAAAARDIKLRSAPAGRPVKAIPKGLHVTILSRRNGWVKVRTPAGDTGWLPSTALTFQ